ncbi:MAG: hypothetical protein M1445_14965 [Bacteroidetes bacterium]|nr:hypothetical protein [Bacteroidota bacterium]
MNKKIDKLLDKTKEMADKAEALLGEGFEKAKESGAYAKITVKMEKVGAFVDKKIVELKESGLPDKMENLREKAGTKAETVIDQAKAYGTLLAGDIDEVIDNVKEKLSPGQKNNH